MEELLELANAHGVVLAVSDKHRLSEASRAMITMFLTGMVAWDETNPSEDAVRATTPQLATDDFAQKSEQYPFLINRATSDVPDLGLSSHGHPSTPIDLEAMCEHMIAGKPFVSFLLQNGHIDVYMERLLAAQDKLAKSQKSPDETEQLGVSVDAEHVADSDRQAEITESSVMDKDERLDDYDNTEVVADEDKHVEEPEASDSAKDEDEQLDDYDDAENVAEDEHAEDNHVQGQNQNETAAPHHNLDDLRSDNSNGCIVLGV